jgi:hypothetical protein
VWSWLLHYILQGIRYDCGRLIQLDPKPIDLGLQLDNPLITLDDPLALVVDPLASLDDLPVQDGDLIAKVGDPLVTFGDILAQVDDILPLPKNTYDQEGTTARE